MFSCKLQGLFRLFFRAELVEEQSKNSLCSCAGCPYSLAPRLVARNKKEHLAVWNIGDSGAQGAHEPDMGEKGGQTVVKCRYGQGDMGSCA